METSGNATDLVLGKVMLLVRERATLLGVGEELDPDRPFVELGVDSFGLIDLLGAIDDSFGVFIPDNLLVQETFRSTASLAATIERLLADRS